MIYKLKKKYHFINKKKKYHFINKKHHFIIFLILVFLNYLGLIDLNLFFEEALCCPLDETIRVVSSPKPIKSVNQIAVESAGVGLVTAGVLGVGFQWENLKVGIKKIIFNGSKMVGVAPPKIKLIGAVVTSVCSGAVYFAGEKSKQENLKILSDLLSGNIKEAGSDIGILIAKKVGIPGIESSDFFKPDLIVKGVTTPFQFQRMLYENSLNNSILQPEHIELIRKYYDFERVGWKKIDFTTCLNNNIIDEKVNYSIFEPELFNCNNIFYFIFIFLIVLLLIYNKSIRYYIKLILQYCNAYFREYFIDLSSKNKTYDKSIKYFYLIHFFICTLLIFFIFNRFLNFDYKIFNLIIFILILSKCLNNIYLIWQFRVKFLKSFQKMDFLLKKIIFTVLSNLSIFFNSLIICFFIYQIYLLFI